MPVVTQPAIAIFYSVPMPSPSPAATSDAGWEVLAQSKWPMRGDDQVSYVIFSPIDRLEDRASS